MKEVKKILGEQMELLAQASKREGCYTDKLCNLSRAMAEVAKAAIAAESITRSLDGASQPDKYELRPLGVKHEQEY